MKKLIILFLLILLSGCAIDLFDDSDGFDVYEHNYYRGGYYHNDGGHYHGGAHSHGGGGHHHR
jgi:hypothetical protein